MSAIATFPLVPLALTAPAPADNAPVVIGK